MSRPSSRTSMLGAMLILAAVRSAIAAGPAVTLQSAQGALDRGDAAQAMQMFEQLSEQSESVPAELGLIRATLLAGQFRTAVAYADHLRGEHRESIEGAALAAFLQDRVGRTEIALKQLDALQARAPAQLAPMAVRAEILIDRARPQDARVLLDKWIAQHPADAHDADVQRLAERARLATGAQPSGEAVGKSSGKWPAPAFRPLGPVASLRANEAGNGVVVEGGSQVLTLRVIAARGGGRFVVRNARGEVRFARRASTASSGELTRLQLEESYPQAWSVGANRVATAAGARFCFAFGYALPGGPPAYPVFAAGLLLRADTGAHHVMQITSAQTSGHGGSPLFDAYGRLIGLTLGAESKWSDGSSLTPQLGQGQFAVPVTGAKAAPITRPGEKTPPQPQVEQLYEELSPAIVEIVPLD